MVLYVQHIIINWLYQQKQTWIVSKKQQNLDQKKEYLYYHMHFKQVIIKLYQCGEVHNVELVLVQIDQLKMNAF